MSLASLVKGWVRKYAASEYADGDAPVSMNPRGDVCVASALPLKSELTRMGNTWTCTIATGSAFTYVNAWPTTRAELVLFNGEPSGGKHYLVESAFMVDVTSAAAAQSKCLIGQLALTGIAAPTDDTAQLIYSRSGKRAYSGQAKRAVANTAFCLANKWEILASVNGNANTASIATSCFADLYGGWIIPPGGCLGLAGVASTAAGTAIIGVSWSEVQLPSTS